MFAVPGWSIPAEILKTQGEPASRTFFDVKETEKSKKPSKKRKRGAKQYNGINVNGDNLAELWEKHIEGKNNQRLSSQKDDSVQQEQKRKKRRKDSKRELPIEQGRDLKQDLHYSEKQDPVRKPQVSPAKQKVENGPAAETADKTPTTEDRKEAGKVKYEARMKHKQEKERMRASGELPPPRPTPVSQDPQPSRKLGAHKESTLEVPLDAEFVNWATSSVSPDKASKGSNAKPIAEDESRSKHPKESDSPPQFTIPPPKFKAKPKPESKPSPSNQPPSSHPPNAPLPPSLSTTPNNLPPPSPSPSPACSKLTPLQRKMASKLLSARFRHLNQTLYTTPSTQASTLFSTTPSAYTSYHAGFRAQVAVWPQNPVETLIADVKARGAVRREGLGAQKKAWRVEKRKGKTKTKGGKEVASSSAEGSEQVEPLPRTNGTCTLADLGCGDATLAASLLPSAFPKTKNLNVKIHSFDLAQGDGPNAHLVTVADITALPLKDGQVDVAVLCLSLMGTNWVSCVDEVARVVRWGGEAWVAETKSRFGRVAKGKDAETGKKKRKGKGGRETKRDDEDDEENSIGELLEVDSDPDILALGKAGKSKKAREEEPDVSGFVEVWRRRGFELKGEVDSGNKMFVRMRFVKRGKGKRDDDGTDGGRDENRGKRKMGANTKSIEEEEVVGAEEAKVLKPCVYKLR